MIKSLKKTAKANLGDLTSQIIDLELKGEEYTPQCQLLWDKARCLTWFIRQKQQKRTALNVWRDAAIRDIVSRKNHKLGSLGDLI